MTDFIGYEGLTQAALRGVVREALRQTQANGGMIGDHHFYVTFLTKAPGVKMADHLIERFPHEMTIVVQHQYWDLDVHDAHFELVLKFSGVPQHLHIPFTALSRFVDPSVNFGLSFESGGAGDNDVVGPVMDSTFESDAGATDHDEIEPVATEPAADGTIVNLDAFRKR